MALVDENHVTALIMHCEIHSLFYLFHIGSRPTVNHLPKRRTDKFEEKKCHTNHNENDNNTQPRART